MTKVRKELEQTKEELNKTKQELEQAKKSEQRSESKFPDLDLVIVLDTTGSMGKSIEGLKQEVEQLAEVLLKLSPSLNLGVISFKDRVDRPVTTQFSLQSVSASGPSMRKLKGFLATLEAGGARNNDVPEALYAGLQKATAMRWRNESKMKLIVVVTDAPPYRAEVNTALAATRRFAAQGGGRKISGVFVDPGSSRPEAVNFLKRMSESGRGSYVRSGGSMTASILLALLGN